MLRKFVLLVLAFATLTILPATHAQDAEPTQAVQLATTQTLTVGDTERSYELYVPVSLDESQAAPLVIALHPFGSSGRAWELLTGFDAAAEEHAFLVAYPNALDMLFDDGQIAEGFPPTFDEVDDVGFIAALIDEVSAEHDISEVYLSGFDDGANMAFRLACELPERFAKVAIVGAQLWTYQRDNCPADSAPVSILLINGTVDDHVPLAGQTIAMPGDVGRFEMLTAGFSLDFWREHNGCDPESKLVLDETRFQLYESCENGTTAGMLLLDGVGHSWLRDGDYALNQVGVDTTEMVTEYFLGGEPWNDDTPDLSTLWDDTTRSYHVYVPQDYSPDTPLPVVFALHGRPDNGAGFAYRMDMNKLADSEGFIAVYPDGINNGWNYTSDLGRYINASENNDQEYLRLLLLDLAKDMAVDMSRVYILGFSNGGFMTQRLACDRADEYAAFGVIGATLVPEYVELCEGRPPVPLVFMHGTEDPSIPWDGTFQGQALIAHSVFDTIDFWAYHNGCDRSQFTNDILPESGDSPGTLVHKILYTACPEDAPVLFYGIEGAGHNIPGVANRLNPTIARDVNMDIHAATEMWEFFQQFSLSEE